MRRPYWLNRYAQATTNPFLHVEDYVHAIIIFITKNRMTENEEICWLLNVQSPKKGNSKVTHTLWWSTKSVNPIWRPFTFTQFFMYALPIKDLRKIATLFTSHSNNIWLIDAAKDKMLMFFSWRFKHNTTHWFGSHTGMKNYFQIAWETMNVNNIRGMKLLYTKRDKNGRDKMLHR